MKSKIYSERIPHYASGKGVAAIQFELIVNASQIQYMLHIHRPYVLNL